ncbi:MAG: hypothetical protein U9R05_08205 [Chloroflexota bacterium]|nr:hypothetical protein [Chloroflexota bacterium]
MIALIPIVLMVLGGLALLSIGGYALYEGFAKDATEEMWLDSPSTARIIGIIALLAGLGLLCAPVGYLLFFVVA